MIRAGMVALIGRPNVGKSTLVNAVVGEKVSIVSDKAQTTRRRILGIATTDEWQIAFIDTPGLHEPHTQLGKVLNEEAQAALANVDVILVVLDVSRPVSREDEAIAQLVSHARSDRNSSVPTILCMNKMDLLKAHDVVEHTEAYEGLFHPKASMLTTLTKGHNLEALIALIVKELPTIEAPLFPTDEYTDQSERSIAAEFVREKILRLTRQEVPHAVATVVDEWEESEDGKVRIAVSIVVEKDGQKAILIGKKGEMLKRIGTEARVELESLLGRKIFLELFVKVKTDWRQNPRLLKEFGYLD